MGVLRSLFRSRSRGDGVTYKGKETKKGYTYEIYTARSRHEALAFLRRTQVRKERHYLICETPEGAVGKDMIMIFDEDTQERIEYGERPALSKLKKSSTRCIRCGYPVLPAGESSPEMIHVVVLEELKEMGVGMRCPQCRCLWCPFCLRTDVLDACPTCGAKLTLYQE